MYPDYDKSNPDVVRPKTKQGLRFRPVEYWDRDVESGSRPMSFMAPGGSLPAKISVKYTTPPVSLPGFRCIFHDTMCRMSAGTWRRKPVYRATRPRDIP